MQPANHPSSISFKRFFWSINILTVALYVILFRIVGPDSPALPILLLSILTSFSTIGSVTAVVMYMRNYKPKGPYILGGVLVIVGLLFGLFLNLWYILDALQRI